MTDQQLIEDARGHIANRYDTDYKLLIRCFEAVVDRFAALQAGNAELTTVVKSYAVSARSIALWLRAYCDRSLPYDKMISDAAQKAASALARMKAERDAAIADISHVCPTCGQFQGGDCPVLFYKDYPKDCEHWRWRGVQGEV